MKQLASLEFVRSNSHWIEFDHSGNLRKEEVFLTYKTEWRGEPAFVQMSCDRYQHSSGISEWRIYAQRCGKTEHGNEHTDLARRRLGDLIKPLAEGWLASGFYRSSETSALMDLCKRTLKDSRYGGSRDARALIQNEVIRHKLGASCVGLVERACDARDAYDEALERVK